SLPVVPTRRSSDLARLLVVHRGHGGEPVGAQRGGAPLTAQREGRVEQHGRHGHEAGERDHCGGGSFWAPGGDPPRGPPELNPPVAYFTLIRLKDLRKPVCR